MGSAGCAPGPAGAPSPCAAGQLRNALPTPFAASSFPSTMAVRAYRACGGSTAGVVTHPGVTFRHYRWDTGRRLAVDLLLARDHPREGDDAGRRPEQAGGVKIPATAMRSP